MSVQRAAQLVEAGLWLHMSGDVDGARRLFEQALKLDPSNQRAQQLLAGVATGAGFPAAVAPSPAPVDWRGTVTPVVPAAPAAAPKPSIALSKGRPSVPPGLRPRVEESELNWRALAAPMPGPAVNGEPPPVPVVRPVTFTPDATSAWDSQSNPGVRLDDVKPGLGDAMDLVCSPVRHEDASAAESQRIREEVDTLLRGARDLLDLDDHSGAMELILKAQQLAPSDPEVQSLRERSEKTLLAMYESKLWPLTSRPRVVLKDDEIIWLNLDHRAGFVLAQMDGTVTFEDLFEVCGMSRLDTARILVQLIDEGVIER
ncbi:MAG: tetratricopeptide repeat protein [Myxococcaceae bacterium]|nr:tetratricopeptide repeat protein [Myxococcaceae bacterium]